MGNKEQTIYGKGRVLMKGGKKAEMTPKKWLVKDLQEFYLNSGLTGRDFASFSVPNLNFGSKKDEDAKKVEYDSLVEEIKTSKNPIELVVPVATKKDAYERKSDDWSFLIFTQNTKVKENKEDEGIAKSSQLKGKIFLIPKEQKEIKNLSKKKIEELENNGSFEKYQVDDKGSLFKYIKYSSGETQHYIKETIDLSKVQLVKRMAIEKVKNSTSRFGVVANKIDDDWDGQFDNTVKGAKNTNTYYVDLGDEANTNKNLFISNAIIEVYGEKEEKTPAKIVKENTKLPEFVEGSGNIYGYWKFDGKIPTAVVGDAKFRPFHEAKKSNVSSDRKLDKANAKIRKEIREIDEWMQANERVADRNQIDKKQKRRAELVDKMTEDRPMRIYAVKNEGGNRKIDYFVYLGDDRHAPKTADDFKTNSNVYKVRKAGFEILNKTYTPVIEVYGKPHKNEVGQIEYGSLRRIVDATKGGNEELNAFCEAFSKAEKDIGNKTAFKDNFYKHISEELANDIDKQKNDYFASMNVVTKVKKPDTSAMSDAEAKRAMANYKADKTKAKDASIGKKRASSASSGLKWGGILKSKFGEKVLTLALGVAIGAGAVVGLGTIAQAPGYGVDANNRNFARDIASAGAETYITQTLETLDNAKVKTANYNAFENEAEPTLFNYKTIDTKDNVQIDTSYESNIEAMFNANNSNATTFGFNAEGVAQKAVENDGNRNFWARLAVTNWTGLDYSVEGVEGAYNALGLEAGQEVKEHGVVLNADEVVYPNTSTVQASFVKDLTNLGASQENAEVAANAYAESFKTAYAESESQVEANEEQKDEFDITDGNLQETVSTVLGEEVQVIHANYDEDTNHGIIFGLDNDKNLVGVEFDNGANFNIEITNAEGLETALLEATANNNYMTAEYKPFDNLNLSQSNKDRAYKYLGELYGESAGIYYNITPVKADGTNDAHYETKILSFDAENLNVTHEVVNVYSDTHQTVTSEDVVKTAISEVTEGKYAGATSLYTNPNEATIRVTIENELDGTTIEQGKDALDKEETVLQTGSWTAKLSKDANPYYEK